MSSQPTRIVACPTCQTAAKWAESNPYRPFCSERCKLIDFGEWAGEGHIIAGEEGTGPMQDEEY